MPANIPAHLFTLRMVKRVILVSAAVRGFDKVPQMRLHFGLIGFFAGCICHHELVCVDVVNILVLYLTFDLVPARLWAWLSTKNTACIIDICWVSHRICKQSAHAYTPTYTQTSLHAYTPKRIATFLPAQICLQIPTHHLMWAGVKSPLLLLTMQKLCMMLQILDLFPNRLKSS